MSFPFTIKIPLFIISSYFSISSLERLVKDLKFNLINGPVIVKSVNTKHNEGIGSIEGG